MLRTRHLNRWLGTSYTLDEVAGFMEREPLFFDVFESLVVSLMEPKKEKM